MQYSIVDQNTYSQQLKIPQLIQANATVLDVGCSTGIMAEKLQKKGCKVDGIEIDPAAAELAKKYCEQVINTDIENLSDHALESKKYDVIIMADILEHLKSPKLQLTRMKKYLQPEGKLIISLPNIANFSIRWSLFCGKFNYTDTGIMDRTHLHFFTKSTAYELLRQAGLEIINFDFTQGIDQIKLLDKTLLKVFRRFPWYYRELYLLTKLWPQGLALQFILVSKIKQGD